MANFTHYLEFGHGDTLILLPSNWLTSWSYQSIGKTLSANYRVIIPDLFRGQSRYSKNALTLNDYTIAMHGFVQELQLKHFFLIGISFSSLIALDYLNQYPTEPKKVMLISPIAYPVGSKGHHFTIAQGILGYLKLFFHNFGSRTGFRLNLFWLYDGIFNYLIKHPAQFLLDVRIATSELTTLLPHLPFPTKIIFAGKDEFIPSHESRKHNTKGNLEVETIPGNHTWFFLNQLLLAEKVFKYFTTSS